MHISSDTILISPDDQGDLTMSLQAPQAVNNMASGLFQLFGPDNVIFLIKPSFQFYKNRYLFAIFCSFCQSRNNRRMAADPI